MIKVSLSINSLLSRLAFREALSLARSQIRAQRRQLVSQVRAQTSGRGTRGTTGNLRERESSALTERVAAYARWTCVLDGGESEERKFVPFCCTTPRPLSRDAGVSERKGERAFSFLGGFEYGWAPLPLARSAS